MIQLMQGDCLERMVGIPDGSVDLVLADPPYGTTDCKWDSVIPLAPMWAHLKRVLKPTGAIVMMASQPFTTTLISSNTGMFKYCWVWDKKFAANFSQANFQPLKTHEDIVVFSKSPATFTKTTTPMTFNPQKTKRDSPIKLGRNSSRARGACNLQNAKAEFEKKIYEYKNPESILPYSNRAEGKRVHPTQKPVALMAYLVKTYTNEGETVLDFTMGSGTTGVACKNLDRRFVGIELDPEYLAVAQTRIAYAHEELFE